MTISDYDYDYEPETLAGYVKLVPEPETLYQASHRPKAYITVIAKSISFDTAVNKMMSMGWELYGDPYITKDGDFAQAMVKYYVDTKEN